MSVQGSMRVYSQEQYQSVQEAAAEGLAQTQMLKMSRMRRPATIGSSDGRDLGVTPRGGSQKLSTSKREVSATQFRLKKYAEEAEKKTKEDLRKLREKAARRKEVKERKFQKMLASLDSENQLKAEVDEYLENREGSLIRKRQQLYKEWCKNVFNPIQRDIQFGLDARSTSEIEARRREHFGEYIDAVSRKKGGVFRDILGKDYDPLKAHNSTLKYNRSKYDADDPMHRDVLQIEEEGRLIRAINPGVHQIRHQPRESLDILLWDKLDCTPYARYADPDNKTLHKRPVPGAPVPNKSNVEFDHYKIPRDEEGKRLVKTQYFPGGKIVKLPPTRKENLVYHHDTPYFEKLKFVK